MSEASTAVNSAVSTVKSDVAVATTDVTTLLSKIEAIVKTEVSKLKTDENTIVAEIKANKIILPNWAVVAIFFAGGILGVILTHL